jgi:hypothetical protein
MAKVENRYLMQDGTYADPAECAKGKDGSLRHKESGLLVAMTADGDPITVASGAVMNKNVDAANAGKEVPAAMPEPQPPPETPGVETTAAKPPADVAKKIG